MAASTSARPNCSAPGLSLRATVSTETRPERPAASIASAKALESVHSSTWVATTPS